MSRADRAINSEAGDWGYSEDAGERVWLLQSPSVDSIQPPNQSDNRRGGTSSFGAVFIVVNAALGAGLLHFPAAFNMAGGITAGVTLQMCMMVFSITGLVILAYCSQSNRGPQKYKGCNPLLYTPHFLVIGAINHESEKAISSHWYTDRKFTITLTSVLIILPLSIPKEIGFQKYASTLSVIGTWYVTIIIIVKYIWPDKDVSPGIIPVSPASWTDVFNAMPTICFGFQCHVSSVPVFNSMKKPEIRPWWAVVTVSMIICLFVYTGTGVCGFLSFGSSVSQDVLMSYRSNDVAVAIARAFIIICVVTSYPILHFCGRAVLEGLWLRFKGEEVETDVTRERRRRILQTLVWFCLTLILALFIPDIGRVISLIGGLAACFIFVFPGLCLIQAKLSEHEVRSASWNGIVAYGVVMVTIGAFIFGQTTTNAIYQDINHANSQ
ncbi:sodium-coupled neutral amino acid transporter 7 isoform X2 [Sinocyclocheilus anshuiensis]|uniref:sodium-coupled neutral amino acid transporter 7 isoform X2 n=1 Tax=Sinocyclocheilus anshuiensis TaxID=1608454 RepID=UPI0007B9A126|nr:PREDICTED: putative sodium-coupled neutral amino acid transporter 7 isoform X2 [Sinocyclocheilus anshuiensis]